MYAVIEDGGRQLKVREGDHIQLDLRDSEVGESIELDRVLLCRDEKQSLIGEPAVEGALVIAEVVEHVKGPKVKIQKIRRRKGYRRLTGHRQKYTEVAIREIRLP